ncbi:MAG: TonB-dependent receptor [Tannerella sp.]|jgi:iron complex outermembrane receptor protein|nr:TonB-dependent receptor [Tannerella sp.]
MKRKRINGLRVFRFRRFARKSYSAFNSMHRVVNIGVLTGCMLVFARTAPAPAQTVDPGPPPETLLEEELETVTVTAARIETPAGQTARAVTVIRRAQIESAPVRSIEELLNYVAGIDVVQRGGHGVQADISLRGGPADQTAVLLNGVNFTSPHTGHYSFDLPVNLSDIERIEVIHGPAALIYGSGAFSGGINIVTRKEIDARLYAGARAGMHALHEAEVRGAARAGRTVSSLSAGYRASDGYIENSDYRLFDLFLQTGREAGEHSRIDWQWGYNRKRYGANTFYSALYPNQYEQTDAYAASLKGTFGKVLKCIPVLYWNRHYDRFDLIRNTETGRNRHRGDTYGASLMFQYASRLGVTGFGGEWRREAILSSNLGRPLTEPRGGYTHHDGRTGTSLTLEHTVEWRRFVFSAGALACRNTLPAASGLRFYPSVSAAFRPLPALRIHAAWSRSTRLPTFTDLYYTTETHVAGEGLRPERSESLDWGVRFNHPFVTATLAAYLMRGRDIIDWVRASGDDRWASWNLTGIDRRGVEAGLTFRLSERWPALDERATLSLSYARMSQTCDARGLESRYSLNYLRDKLTAQLSHPVYRGLSAGWHVRFQKRMGVFRKYENGKDAGLHPFPAFSTLDLKLNYAHGRWNFFLDLNNLYDTHYYDTGNVPQAGRWLTGGISYRIY